MCLVLDGARDHFLLHRIVIQDGVVYVFIRVSLNDFSDFLLNFIFDVLVRLRVLVGCLVLQWFVKVHRNLTLLKQLYLKLISSYY